MDNEKIKEKISSIQKTADAVSGRIKEFSKTRLDKPHQTAEDFAKVQIALSHHKAIIKRFASYLVQELVKSPLEDTEEMENIINSAKKFHGQMNVPDLLSSFEALEKKEGTFNEPIKTITEATTKLSHCLNDTTTKNSNNDDSSSKNEEMSSSSSSKNEEMSSSSSSKNEEVSFSSDGDEILSASK